MKKDQFDETAGRLIEYLAADANFRRAFAATDSSVANYQCTGIVAAFLRKDFWDQKRRPDSDDKGSASFLNDPSHLARFLAEHPNREQAAEKLNGPTIIHP